MKGPAQEPYALQWDNPDWEQVSSRTVVSQRLVQRQYVTLHFMAAGFSSMAAVENYMQCNSAR
jgi:hypothetical protein